jgi:hypothetical protein
MGVVEHVYNPHTSEAQQENRQFEVSLGYIVRLSQNNNNKKFMLSLIYQKYLPITCK